MRPRQTQCFRGHEYTPENIIIRANGSRVCRECKRIWATEYRERNREAIRERQRQTRDAEADNARRRTPEYRKAKAERQRRKRRETPAEG